MDAMATWTSSDFDWQQIHDDGREQVGAVILPPLKKLEQRALAIVRGTLIADRIGGWHEVYEDSESLFQAIKDAPGYLRLEPSTPAHGMAYLQWSIAWQMSGDPDRHRHTFFYMSPGLALAKLICIEEERERELRAEMIEFTGGLA
jgi:hypothetical protein